MRSDYLEKAFDNLGTNPSASEIKLKNYFRANLETAPYKTLEMISEEIETAISTISKFITKIGFDGFKDFKIKMAFHVTKAESNLENVTAFDAIQKDDNLEIINNKIVKATLAMLENLTVSLDYGSLEKAAELINKASTITFIGQGGSSAIAYDAYHKFSRTNKKPIINFDYHLQLISASKVEENDVVIVISHTGRSRESIKITEIAKKSGAKVIVLTGNPHAEISTITDSSIIIESLEAKLDMEVMIARTAYLIVLDSLYMSVMNISKEHRDSLQDIRAILKEVRQ